MPDRVDVTVHLDAIDRLEASGEVRDMLFDASHPVVVAAKARAPKATGQGAAHIHTEMILNAGEWEAFTSWDQEQFYMYWHERGSRQLPARPFLVPALRAAAFI